MSATTNVDEDGCPTIFKRGFQERDKNKRNVKKRGTIQMTAAPNVDDDGFADVLPSRAAKAVTTCL